MQAAVGWTSTAAKLAEDRNGGVTRQHLPACGAACVALLPLLLLLRTHACMYAAVSGALRVCQQRTCGIVGQFVNFLMPSRTPSSANTLRLPYLKPAQHITHGASWSGNVAVCWEMASCLLHGWDGNCVCCSASPSACVCLSRTRSNAHCCLGAGCRVFWQKRGCLPYAFRIWQAMLLKPHWGASGVPCRTCTHTTHMPLSGMWTHSASVQSVDSCDCAGTGVAVFIAAEQAGSSC